MSRAVYKFLDDRARQRELRRCTRGPNALWYLLTKYLDRGFNPEAHAGRGAGLTERMHRPVCSWIDRTDVPTPDGVRMGVRLRS